MNQPAVSVCLPVYNGEKFLSEAVKSVLEQNFADFELIVVDDVSSDGSADLVSSFAASDERVRLYRNETNLGLFFNYNKCMELSRGRYIKPFAQDDLWHQSILKRMVHELDARPGVSLVACAREYVDPQGRVLSTLRCQERDQEIDGKQTTFDMVSRIDNFIGEPCAVMYRREQMGSGFVPTLPQLGDIEYWSRLLLSGNLFFISDVLCKFRVHQENQTKKNIASLDYLADLIAVRELYHEFLVERGVSSEALSACILAKAIDVTNYATTIGVDYSQSNFTALTQRPRELGLLLIDALKRLAAIEPEYSGLRSRVDDLEQEMSRLHSELSGVLNSPSWKVTAGLREIRKLTSSLLDIR